MAAWLAAGLAGGFWLGRGNESGAANGTATARTVNRVASFETAETVSATKSRYRADTAERSVTPEQLTLLAQGQGRLPPLDDLMRLLNAPLVVAGMSAAENDRRFEALFSEVTRIFKFNDEESKKIRELFRAAAEDLLEIESRSLVVREVRPGTLELDPRADVAGRSAVVDRLRTRLRDTLGARALDDLDVIGGLEDLTRQAVTPLAHEMIFERAGKGWKIWSIVPGPGGREMKELGHGSELPYAELVAEAMVAHDSGRFARSAGRVPEILTEPP